MILNPILITYERAKKKLNTYNNSNRETLVDDIYDEDIDTINHLLENGVDVNSKDPYGKTPLHKAALLNNVEAVQHLLAKKADPNVSDDRGYTPFHEAVASDNREIVNLLLNNKTNPANPNAKDNSGQTPLHVAARLGNKKIVEDLLKAGADLSLRDKNDKLPFDELSLENNPNQEVTYIIIRGMVDQEMIMPDSLKGAFRDYWKERVDLQNRKINVPSITEMKKSVNEKSTRNRCTII